MDHVLPEIAFATMQQIRRAPPEYRNSRALLETDPGRHDGSIDAFQTG